MVCRLLQRARDNSGQEREGGFAVLLTIWILMLISLMAASLAAQTQSETRVSHNRTELAIARALADAGVAVGLNGLLNPIVSQRWPADGRARVVRYGDGVIEIRIQDEAGKLDLNAAPVEIIAGLFRRLGIDDGVAADAIEGILARRRLYGAGLSEAAQAAATENETPLAQAVQLPFATVSELRLVAPLSEPDYERIRPFVTVYTNSPRIDLLTAPASVLLALPGIREDEILAYVTSRQALIAGQSDQDLPQISGANKFAENGELRAATIMATATARDGAMFAREAVYSLTLERALNPYSLLQWVQAPDIEPTPAAAQQ
jgi:general secretion pathway protein K